jgi:hypothetical protein
VVRRFAGRGCGECWGAVRLGVGVQTGCGGGDAQFERSGEMQAVRDARDDQRDIVGAEVADGEAEGGGAVLAQRAGEFAAVVDERADEDEQTEGAGGLWGWVGGRAGHERNRNMKRRVVSRKSSYQRRSCLRGASG